MYGYQGRFLNVDLNNKTVSDMPLKEDDLKKFIGGAGLAAKLIYDRIGNKLDGFDPLCDENPLVFATGPFTGTTIPMVSRYAICGISPLTGYWGEATSGGSFAFRLKGAGYDGIFITGKADMPVYIDINSGKAEIKDAAHLWGKDSYETQAIIKETCEDEKASIACIGSTGEKMARYSCIVNDKGRVAGRCGLGALMGSKKLKAIVVAGNLKAEIADKEQIKELTKTAQLVSRNGTMSMAQKEYGTLMYTDMGMALGDVPAKYFTKSVFKAEKVSGQALRQAYPIMNYACTGCPVGCGREVVDFSPELKSVDGPEYETVAAFGPLCMNFDLDSIIRANHMCNVHGLDTISTGVSIAYAMYLFEKGVLTEEKTGMKIQWGDAGVILKLVEMIINNEGIGALLAKGTLAMARELGRDDGEAAQVKGMELPMHDPRSFNGLAISYATGPRGACHLKGDYYSVDMGSAVKEAGVYPSERHNPAGKGKNAAIFQSLRDLFDSLTLCKFSPLSVTQLGQILTSITGWEYSPQDIIKAGDRSINIKRVISNKLGLSREGDKLPDICLKPLEEGSTAGQVPDMDKLLKDYYQHRQWDWETGRPSKAVLLDLGLDQMATDLYS